MAKARKEETAENAEVLEKETAAAEAESQENKAASDAAESQDKEEAGTGEDQDAVQAAVAEDEGNGLLSLSALADKHRVASWRQAALLRYMGWEDDKLVSEANYKDALAALDNRRIGGGRK